MGIKRNPPPLVEVRRGRFTGKRDLLFELGWGRFSGRRDLFTETSTPPPKKKKIIINNKEVSSDKQAAPLGLLQPAQQQTRSLSRDNVPVLIAIDFMDVIIFDEESSDVPSDKAAALLQSIPSPN